MPSAHPCRQQHQDKKRASCIFARTGFSCRLFPLTPHGRRGATPRSPGRGHGGIPRHGGAPGAGSTGCRAHGGGFSACQREAPTLGKPSPGGGGCCPRRGSGASAARCSQGAHSAPDAFSNLARLARLRQRGRGASALTLARPGGRPRCRGVPSGLCPARDRGAALLQDTERAGLSLSRQHPRVGSAQGPPVPTQTNTDTQHKSMCLPS